MTNINMIIHSSGLNVQKQYVCYPEFPNIEYFFICSDEISSLRQQSVYIGTKEQIQRLIPLAFNAVATLFIITDYSDECWQMVHAYQCNLLYIPDSIINIYNKLNTSLNTYNHWQNMLELMSFQQLSLPSLVEASAKILECPVFLINTGYSLIASHYKEPPVFTGSDELIHKGFLSIDHIMALREDPFITITPVRLGVVILAHVLTPLPDDDYRIKYYLPLLLKTLKAQISLSVPGSPLFYRIGFEQLVYDLIELNINSKEEIEQRINLANLKLKSLFSCIVIEPSSEKMSRPINPMIPGLQSIFSNGYFCIYRRTIVGVIPCDEYDQIDYENKALKDLLYEWNAVAGFSSLAFSIDQLRTFYLMCVHAIRFGRTFGNENDIDNVIYHYEDFRVFHMIDMCKDSFVRMYHHDNLLYLCHPLIIRLYLYDLNNQSNLLSVLGTFLKHNCNLAQTARVLNYHRNTMLNKIHKIESILQTKLDNNQLNQTLMLSYMTLQYISVYLKKDIFKERSTPKTEFVEK